MEGENGYRKGLWTGEEDRTLMDYIRTHGKGKWNQVARLTGLKRCGKSCRLRWINYLSPAVKRGDFSEEEEDLIIRLHNLLGNRWSLIAGRVPGRTDNQVKNHWNTHLSKKLGIKKAKLKASGSAKSCAKMIEKSSRVSAEVNNEEGGERLKGSSQELITTVNESSNSWFSDGDFDIYTPGLMDFLDGCALGFDWHSL